MKAEELLAGYSVSDPFLDDTAEDNLEKSFKLYDCKTFIDLIDKPDFEYVFKDVVMSMKETTIQDQRIFLRNVFSEFNNIYGVDLSVDSFCDQDEINDMYDFISFVVFDNVEILLDAWKKLLKDSFDDLFNLDKIPMVDKYQIISIFDCFDSKNKLIDGFLKSYPGELLVEWFYNKTTQNKEKIKIAAVLREE